VFFAYSVGEGVRESNGKFIFDGQLPPALRLYRDRWARSGRRWGRGGGGRFVTKNGFRGDVATSVQLLALRFLAVRDDAEFTPLGIRELS
jgi:hypothetical protein